MDRQRVHASRKFAGERRVDHTVPLQTALSAKGFRHNIKTEMRFAARAVTRMAFVQMRFIFDLEALRGESRSQFRRNSVLHTHNTRT